MRHYDAKRCARENAGPRELDVERKEDPHSGRRALQNTPIDTLLFAAEGRRPLFGGI
jgi:hypothetical protein